MRIRRITFASLAAVVFALVLAAPAFAQEDPEDPGAEGTEELLEIGECKGEEAEEVLAADAEGDTEHANELLEDCYSSPNPLLPKTNEIFWGGIAWLIVIAAVVKFAVPQLRKTMQAREEKIRSDLEAAERTRADAERERQQYEQRIADARDEAGRIIEEGRQAGEAVRADVIARAEQEANEIRTRAQADIAIQRERVMAELRGEVADLSIDLAERIVERNLDRDTQRQLVESFINQVGRSN